MNTFPSSKVFRSRIATRADLARSSVMIDRDEPGMGVHFPLADFEQRIMADPDVLGMMYNGSLGRAEADRYSDLDISLWVRDEALAKPGRSEHYLGWLGAIQFVSWSHHESGLSSN